MRKLLLMVLSVLLVVKLIGCEPYTAETNTSLHLAPVPRNAELTVTKSGDRILFQVVKNGYIVEADECILRNDNTHEMYSNFGDYQNIIYILQEDGYYTFGFHKDDIEVIYNFKLSELKESQAINY